MFTGIVEETGEIAAVRRETGRALITVRAQKTLEGTQPGDSISIDGACQTVAEMGGGTFSVWTLAESLKKTTLGSLAPGSLVNLERALRLDTRLGGHIVQGHVNCAVRIREIRQGGGNVYLAVVIPPEFRRYCVAEGSIALDGTSLTIADIAPLSDGGCVVSVNIIPATFEGTALKTKRAGGNMNLECDILARYVENLLVRGGAAADGRGATSGAVTPGGLSFERLRELGY